MGSLEPYIDPAYQHRLVGEKSGLKKLRSGGPRAKGASQEHRRAFSLYCALSKRSPIEFPAAVGLQHTNRPSTRTQSRRHFFLQCLAENLAHVVHKDEADIFEEFLRDFVHVATVLGRQNDLRDPRTASCQNLLFNASDRQHVSPQGYLTCHRHVFANRALRQRRHHRRRQRDSGRRAILGNRALGNVYVQIVVVEILGIDFELFRPRLRIRVSRLRRFAHHFAELSGQHQVALPFHPQSFDKQYVATHRGPCESGRDSYLIFLQYFFGNNLGRAEKLVQILERHSHGAFLTFTNPPRDLAADGSDFAFKLAQSRLLRVSLNYRGQRGGRDVHVTRRDAIFFHLFWQQMPEGDLQLFLFRVTSQADHFHAIAQSRLDGVENIRRRHEDDIRQIKSDAEIIIAKAVVLFRIENFQQR